MGIIQMRVDDLDGTLLADDVEPVTFGWDGKVYNIDLNEINYGEFAAFIERFVEAATPVEPVTRPTRAVKQTTISARPAWRARDIGEMFIENESQQWLRKNPEHHLADKEGNVVVAKEVIVNALGTKRVMCFWCDKQLAANASKARSGDFVVSHLDKDKNNYAPDNVVPAHIGCNRGWILTKNPMKLVGLNQMIELHKKNFERN